MAGRTESIIPQQPTGAARKRDYTWPDPYINSTGAVSNTIRDRPGMSNSASGGITVGATGALTVGVVNGATCARFTNGGTLNAGAGMSLDPGRYRVNLLGANVKFSPFTDDYGAWRFYCIMRVTATPTDATACGMGLINGPNISLSVFTGSGPGFAINYDNTGSTVSLVIQQDTGAIISTVVSPGGYLNTDFHAWEWRVLGARPGVNASIKTLLDGNLRDVRSWPNNLPSPAGVGGQVNNGFGPNIQYQSRNGELDVAVARIQFAPTESDLF